MKLRWFCLHILLAVTALTAQDLPWYSLLTRDDDALVPLLPLKELFPWGTLPVPQGRAALTGPVLRVETRTQTWSYPFGVKTPVSESVHVFSAGRLDGDWLVDGQAVAWTRDGESYVWTRSGDAKLVGWRGRWEAPDLVEVYRQGLSTPVETWVHSATDPSAWTRTSGDGTQVWKVVRGLSTVWTGYGPDGRPAARISVTKDAKGTVVAAQRWSAPDRQEYDVALSPTAQGSSLRVTLPDGVRIEGVFTKAGAPISLRDVSSATSWHYDYDLDKSGAVVAIHDWDPDRETLRQALVWDAGNLVSLQRLTPDTSFGDTQFTVSVSQTRLVVPRKATDSPAAAVTPADLATWLAPVAGE